MLKMCQYRLINCDKCTALVEDIDIEEGYACVGTGGRWEISGPSAHFCYEPKSALKKSIF